VAFRRSKRRQRTRDTVTSVVVAGGREVSRPPDLPEAFYFFLAAFFFLVAFFFAVFFLAGIRGNPPFQSTDWTARPPFNMSGLKRLRILAVG
jgi:hypothetical protein